MSTSTVARVYVETLLRLADRDDAVDAVSEGIETLGRALESSRDFRTFLEAPQIDADAKREVIATAFDGRVHPLVLRFADLVISRKREALFPRIAAAWRELIDERANRQTATVDSAVPIDDVTLEAMRRALEEATGKNITIDQRVDEDLLGGVVVKTGDLVMDASLRSKLSNLGRRLRAPSTSGA